MTEFIYEKFLEDPDGRWSWLAQAVLIAKHRLKNPALALKYAHAIAANTTPQRVPHWAGQMEIFLLEDLGEKEAAKVLIKALLDSGEISDSNELAFLSHRLATLND